MKLVLHIVSFGLLLAATSLPASAQDAPILPDNVTFVTSAGFWQESSGPDTAGTVKPDATDTAQATPQRGYYKLIAVRQPEGNAHIVLQQIALDAGGPKVLSSAELDEFSWMKSYVTDIRPESSSGISAQPGLFATVYLKTDPASTEPEAWTVIVDDLGDIKVERATN